MTSRTLRYLLAALGICLFFLACCTQADAQSPFWRPRPLPPPYSFSVEDENGNSLPTFAKDGRSFVLGEPGLRYNLRVCNPSALRVEAVVSVDGRDAMSGDQGNYVKQRGYVVPAYGCTLVEGFRRSLEEVAAFRFTSPGDSYSSRMGTPQNVGVIGVAFFPERVRPMPVIRRWPARPRPMPEPYDYSGRNDQNERLLPSRPMKRAAAPAPSEPTSAGPGSPTARDRGEAKATPNDDFGSSGTVDNLGTQFGETRESVVSSVAFERASVSHPALVRTLRYDDADGLRARGIDVAPPVGARRIDDEPEPFPLSRFAEPPP